MSFAKKLQRPNDRVHWARAFRNCFTKMPARAPVERLLGCCSPQG
jgi:hypothetical protein